LTEECTDAIKKAVEKRQRVRMHYTTDMCILEVDYEHPDSLDFRRFSCVVQPMGNSQDAICYDPRKKRYQALAPLETKFQVKATEKTFDETREKTKKLIEEQQKRKAQDVTQQHSSRHPTPSSFSKHRSTVPFIKKHSSSSVTSSSGVATSVTQKKPVHGISIKPSNSLAPVGKNRVAGAKPTEVCSTIGSVSASQKMETKLVPKPVENSDCVSGSQPAILPPPVRVSPKNLPPPVNNQYKKRYFADDPNTHHMIARKKRNESGTSSSASASSGTSSTEVSPPNFYQQIMLANKNKISTDNAPSATTKDLPNGCLTQPTKPSKDWAQIYGEIESMYDAKKYHEIFSAEYPEYFECYKTLSAVAKEFVELEKQLRATQIGTPNHYKAYNIFNYSSLL
jgi:hypothetical protein